MEKIYLLFNAFLYLVFAILCSVNPHGTASGLGYITLNNSGLCEYVVVYGGMEMGFAVFFLLTALNANLRTGGVLFALCLYGGIVSWRAVSAPLFWPVSGITLGTAALEVLLLVGALCLWKSNRRSAAITP